MNSQLRNHPWPTATGGTDPIKTPETTATVTVNYNTKSLVTQLIWTIFDALGGDGFAKILVVDNHSSDGSQDLLQALADDGLIDFRANDQNTDHGPALNQAFDELSRAQQSGIDRAIHAIWVLDSDCVVLRPDVLAHATSVMTDTGAAIVGQPVWDEWNHGTFGLHSLLIDSAQVWRNPIVPFEEDGEPSRRLQESCIAAGLTMTPFGFTAGKHIVHLGRGTLAQIAENKLQDNRYFAWAEKHSAPHYAAVPDGERAYAGVQARFMEAVPMIEILDHRAVTSAIRQRVDQGNR